MQQSAVHPRANDRSIASRVCATAKKCSFDLDLHFALCYAGAHHLLCHGMSCGSCMHSAFQKFKICIVFIASGVKVLLPQLLIGLSIFSDPQPAKSSTCARSCP